MIKNVNDNNSQVLIEKYVCKKINWEKMGEKYVFCGRLGLEINTAKT